MATGCAIRSQTNSSTTWPKFVEGKPFEFVCGEPVVLTHDVTTSWTNSWPIRVLTPRVSFLPCWAIRATKQSRAFVRTIPGLSWPPRESQKPVNNCPVTSRAFRGLMGGCGRENPAPPASPASSPASIPINIFFGRCERGNTCFLASRGFPCFVPRVYPHQSAPGGCKRGNISPTAIPRLPRLPPSRLFSSNAPPGSSTRGNDYFRMLRPFPPATYPIHSPPLCISLTSDILYIIYYIININFIG
jgi:hypothetical protein